MDEKLKFTEATTITHDASALVLPTKSTLPDPSEVLWDVITFGHDENGNISILKYEPSVSLTPSTLRHNGER